MWSFTSVYIKVYSCRCDIDLYKALALKKVSVLFVSLEEIVSASIRVLSLIFQTQMRGIWVLFASSVSYCHSVFGCIWMIIWMLKELQWMSLSLSVKLVNLECMLINRYLFYLKKSLVLFVMTANTLSSQCNMNEWTSRWPCAELSLMDGNFDTVFLLWLFRILWKAFIHYHSNLIAVNKTWTT